MTSKCYYRLTVELLQTYITLGNSNYSEGVAFFKHKNTLKKQTLKLTDVWTLFARDRIFWEVGT